MEEDDDISADYYRLIHLGEQLLKDLQDVNPNGICKLRKKIGCEINTLRKFRESGTLKKEHLTSSNLSYYEVIVSRLLERKSADCVLQPFSLKCQNQPCKKLIVDIVSEKNRLWTKAIARNPKALSQISRGEGGFRQKSILDHAKEYVECASQHLVLYEPPVVEFYFAFGVESDLAEELLQCGVRVNGKLLESDESGEVDLPPVRIPEVVSSEIKLNLDVSTMIAYISSVTNGGHTCKLRGRDLIEQALREKVKPVKPILDKYFEGKSLFTCKTAADSLMSIVELLGGRKENERAKELLSRVKVVPDQNSLSFKVGGRIKPRSIVIFGTGIAIKAVTVTANLGFVSAARSQGLELDVFEHESRALTELNEIHDDPVS